MRCRMICVAHAVLVLSTGCGGDAPEKSPGKTPEELHAVAQSLCQAAADCMGTDSTWVEGCVADTDSQVAAAQSYGCLDVMAAWFSCLDQRSTCATDNGYTDQGACSDEEELGEDCRKGRL